MTGAMEWTKPDLVGRSRWWLPRVGVGNGLDDVVWTPVLEVDAQVVADLLVVLREDGVPAFASPIGVARLFRGTRPTKHRYLLWLGTSRSGMAEARLRTLGRMGRANSAV